MTEAAIFYENASRNLGIDFLADIHRVIDLLRTYPSLGHSVGSSLRRAMLTRFPFTLIYAVEPEAILIVAVAHQRRRPEYWKDRIVS